MTPTRRVADALGLMFELHHTQRRKGANVPYITHLMAVAALVGEHGGDEDQFIAALLHDAVEDQGGPATLARIRALFGDGVAAYVDECSDTDAVPKPPWQERKEAHVAHVAQASAGLKLIVAADKLHNLRSTLRDLHAQGDPLWARFRGGRDNSLWYYRAMLAALRMNWEHPILVEYALALHQLEELAARKRE